VQNNLSFDGAAAMTITKTAALYWSPIGRFLPI
jgi:hypothetical protein